MLVFCSSLKQEFYFGLRYLNSAGSVKTLESLGDGLNVSVLVNHQTLGTGQKCLCLNMPRLRLVALNWKALKL